MTPVKPTPVKAALPEPVDGPGIDPSRATGNAALARRATGPG